MPFGISYGLIVTFSFQRFNSFWAGRNHACFLVFVTFRVLYHNLYFRGKQRVFSDKTAKNK